MKRIYPIDIFPWGRPEVYPESQAELEFLEDGIFVCLSAKEKNPRCSVTFPGGRGLPRFLHGIFLLSVPGA